MGAAGLRRIQSSPVALSSLGSTTKKGSANESAAKKADAKTHQQKVARR
jgi:hypothetical protein